MKSPFRDLVLIRTNVQIWSRKRPDLPLKSRSCLIGQLYIGPKLIKLLVECKNSLGATNWNIFIFAAERFSLSVNFFTAWDGVVMFSHYFKHFCILVQIATKSPDLLQNRSRKSLDSSWKSFLPPITTYFSTKSRWQNFVSGALELKMLPWPELVAASDSP